MEKKVFVDLIPWSDIPLWPYFSNPLSHYAWSSQIRCLSQKVTMVMHSGTHADSPRHHGA